MSQFLEWISTKIFSSMKNKPYGWGRVLLTPAAIDVDKFIIDFHFDCNLNNHSIVNSLPKGGKVTTVRRNIFVWLGEHVREMEELLK